MNYLRNIALSLTALLLVFGCDDSSEPDVTPDPEEEVEQPIPENPPEEEEPEKLDVSGLTEDSLFIEYVRKIYFSYSENTDLATAYELTGSSFEEDKDGFNVEFGDMDLSQMSPAKTDSLAVALGFADTNGLIQYRDSLFDMNNLLAAKYDFDSVTWEEMATYYQEVIDRLNEDPTNIGGRTTESDSLTFPICEQSVGYRCEERKNNCNLWISDVLKKYNKRGIYIPLECAPPDGFIDIYGPPLCDDSTFLRFIHLSITCHQDYKCCVLHECDDDDGVPDYLFAKHCQLLN